MGLLCTYCYAICMTVTLLWVTQICTTAFSKTNNNILLTQLPISASNSFASIGISIHLKHCLQQVLYSHLTNVHEGKLL